MTKKPVCLRKKTHKKDPRHSKRPKTFKKTQDIQKTQRHSKNPKAFKKTRDFQKTRVFKKTHGKTRENTRVVYL